MYAGTKFNWIDQSYINPTTAPVELDTMTLFFSLITADKGPEGLTRLSGDDFYKMFGRTLSFDKHGQALLQAAKIADAGGELLVKRFVADDATLSNIIVLAKVSEKNTIRTDAEGNPLYIDSTTGEETIESGNNNLPINDTTAVVKYELHSVASAVDYNDVYNAAVELFDDDNGVYPIIIATDIGRNADIKRLAISPDYDTSKTLGFMLYKFYEYENTTSEENCNITMNPDIIYNSRSYAINDYSMSQLKLGRINGVFEAYAQKLADTTGLAYTDLINADLIYGKTVKGANLAGITIDAEGADIGYQFGVELKSGSNGDGFGDIPKDSKTLATKMVNFLSGNETDEIYDLDVHKISVILDANYPKDVKEALAAFVNFREDCVYLRDLGTGLTTFTQINAVANSLTKSKFVADYMTSYQVYDPYTNKRIEVTMLYDMVEPLIDHFQTAPATPIAGEVNGFVISSAIPGTVNYIPRITPSVNQKDELDDARINYATYYEYGGNLVVDSLYSSQTEYTQLSYLCNVIAIQEVMRAVRTECPRNRFRFTNQNDFTEYQEAVNNVLTNFRSSFDTLQMIYEEDPIMASQKIFYAGIQFAFNNWPQSEIFDLFAVNAEDIGE